MTTSYHAIIPGIKEHYPTFQVKAETADAAKAKLEAKMRRSGFCNTARLWIEAGQKVELVKPEADMLAAVWRPVLDRQVIEGWDTFARGAEEARRLIGEAMENEGYHSLKLNWLADGGLLEPVGAMVEVEAAI